MKPVHNFFNTSLSTKQRLFEKRDSLNCDTDAASLTAALYSPKCLGLDVCSQGSRLFRVEPFSRKKIYNFIKILLTPNEAILIYSNS